MLMVDFSKNISTNDSNVQKANLKRAIKRIVYCIVLFLIPYIVSLFNNILGSLGVDYADCLKNATEEYIVERTNTMAAELLAIAKEEKTTSSIEEAAYAISNVTDADIKDKLQAELKQLREEVESQNYPDGGSSAIPTPGSKESDFLYTIPHPDPNYKGHAVSLNGEEYQKVLRSIFGEQEQGSFEMYVGLCQYIRDYIDYGKLKRTYSNLGSFWLKRGGRIDSKYNTEWFKQNKPEMIEAVDYVFSKGGSLAQRKMCFYVDDDDQALNGNNYEKAYKTLVNASCGKSHSHDKVRLSPASNPNNWSEFNFGVD